MDTCENLCTVSIHLIPWQDTGCALHCRTVYDVYMFSMAISQRRRNEFSMDVERIEGWNDYALKISRQAPQQHCSLLSKGRQGFSCRRDGSQTTTTCCVPNKQKACTQHRHRPWVFENARVRDRAGLSRPGQQWMHGVTAT